MSQLPTDNNAVGTTWWRILRILCYLKSLVPIITLFRHLQFSIHCIYKVRQAQGPWDINYFITFHTNVC